MSVVSETFDVTARKFHQYVCVALVIVGFVVGAPAGLWLEGLVGAVLLVGRFWWPADVFRQLAWRILEPAGVLRRRDVQENHETRRVARVLGGAIILIGAALVAIGAGWAWVPIALIAGMIFLDAGFDFCALCWITYQYGRLRPRASGSQAA